MVERNVEGNSGAATETQAGHSGRHAFEEGYERARQYGDKSLDYVGQIGESLADFVRREPLLAVTGAFLVGYLAAQILRRVSR
jgi:ElaB/YqjD/DUF883 family membrane-anchored ribosome-binding protein